MSSANLLHRWSFDDNFEDSIGSADIDPKKIFKDVELISQLSYGEISNIYARYSISDTNGDIYVLTTNGYIFKKGNASENYEIFHILPSGFDYRRFIKTHSGDIYVTGLEGVYMIPSNPIDIYDYILFDGFIDGFKSQYLHSIISDSEGNIYVAHGTSQSATGSVYKKTPSDANFQLIPNQLNERSYIDMCFDDDGYLYLYNTWGEIIKHDTSNNTFEVIISGISAGGFRGFILIDSEDTLYFTTNTGLGYRLNNEVNYAIMTLNDPLGREFSGFQVNGVGSYTINTDGYLVMTVSATYTSGVDGEGNLIQEYMSAVYRKPNTYVLIPMVLFDINMSNIISNISSDLYGNIYMSSMGEWQGIYGNFKIPYSSKIPLEDSPVPNSSKWIAIPQASSGEYSTNTLTTLESFSYNNFSTSFISKGELLKVGTDVLSIRTTTGVSLNVASANWTSTFNINLRFNLPNPNATINSGWYYYNISDIVSSLNTTEEDFYENYHLFTITTDDNSEPILAIDNTLINNRLLNHGMALTQPVPNPQLSDVSPHLFEFNNNVPIYLDDVRIHASKNIQAIFENYFPPIPSYNTFIPRMTPQESFGGDSTKTAYKYYIIPGVYRSTIIKN